MKKRLYNQPEIFISTMMPTTIICASIGEGESVPSGGDTVWGD